MSNVVSGLFSLDAPMVMVLACVFGAVQVAVHILKRAIDLWISTVDRRMPARIEPTWPGKVTPPREASPAALVEQAINGTLPEETSSETSGRHAKVEAAHAATELMLAVDEAVEVGVS